MRRLTRRVTALALSAVLVGAVGVAAGAESTSGSSQAGGSRTVWKHRVLKRGNSDAAHQQPEWKPYRTGDFSAKMQTVSNSDEGYEPMLVEESPVETGPPVYGESCGAGMACGPGMACGTVACGDCGGCGECYDCGAFGSALIAAVAHVTCNLNYFGGVHGFKGPTDLGRNGNFGFNYGMNWGSPLGDPWGLGYQVGVGVVHSNFTGDQIVDIFSADHRDQVFFTSGIFRRAMCGGIQWGVVYDLMRDSYHDNSTTGQIRTEIAFSRPGCRDFGFYGTFGADNDRMRVAPRILDQIITEVDVAPMDIYALFYRRYFTGGGIGRVWGGLTDEGDGVFGADATIPLGTSWALENSFTYVAPNDGGVIGQERESWGVFLRLVWYPGRDATCEINDPYTPLMPVANNTNMLIDANPH